MYPFTSQFYVFCSLIRANDDKCQEIAVNAKVLHDKFLSREGVLDYMQVQIGTVRMYKSRTVAVIGVLLDLGCYDISYDILFLMSVTVCVVCS